MEMGINLVGMNASKELIRSFSCESKGSLRFWSEAP